MGELEGEEDLVDHLYFCNHGCGLGVSFTKAFLSLSIVICLLTMSTKLYDLKKEEGNNAFKKREYDHAYDHYTDAISAYLQEYNHTGPALLQKNLKMIPLKEQEKLPILFCNRAVT